CEPNLYGFASTLTSCQSTKSAYKYHFFGETFVDQQNGYDSRYTFSAKEKDDETQYSYFGARYYDSDLSVWLSIDRFADKYPNLSPYNYCAWNPIKYIDPTGDTIGVTDKLRNNKNAYEGYLKFMDSRAGKKLQKLYGEGGRRYNDAIVFDIDENRVEDNGACQSCIGDTKVFAVSSDSKRQLGYNEPLKSGEHLRFEVSILETPNFKAGDMLNGKQLTAIGAYKKNHEYSNKRGRTMTHEGLHIITITYDFQMFGMWRTSPADDHDRMKTEEDEYYQILEEYDKKNRSIFPK
ncbi:MAG: hypothetical protein CVU14_12145, partial [Bacteroidetes bacterium HGW-Bacteroidetes-9]